MDHSRPIFSQVQGDKEGRLAEKEEKNVALLRVSSVCASSVCFACRVRGHLARDCPRWAGVCFGCRRAGHTRKECAAVSPSKAPALPTTTASSPTSWATVVRGSIAVDFSSQTPWCDGADAACQTESSYLLSKSRVVDQLRRSESNNGISFSQVEPETQPRVVERVCEGGVELECATSKKDLDAEKESRSSTARESPRWADIQSLSVGERPCQLRTLHATVRALEPELSPASGDERRELEYSRELSESPVRDEDPILGTSVAEEEGSSESEGAQEFDASSAEYRDVAARVAEEDSASGILKLQPHTPCRENDGGVCRSGEQTPTHQPDEEDESDYSYGSFCIPPIVHARPMTANGVCISPSSFRGESDWEDVSEDNAASPVSEEKGDDQSKPEIRIHSTAHAVFDKAHSTPDSDEQRKHVSDVTSKREEVEVAVSKKSTQVKKKKKPAMSQFMPSLRVCDIDCDDVYARRTLPVEVIAERVDDIAGPIPVEECKVSPLTHQVYIAHAIECAVEGLDQFHRWSEKGEDTFSGYSAGMARLAWLAMSPRTNPVLQRFCWRLRGYVLGGCALPTTLSDDAARLITKKCDIGALNKCLPPCPAELARAGALC